MQLYDDPALYDALHTRGTAAELDGVVRIVRRLQREQQRQQGRTARAQVWLEPACGTGRFLRGVARRGHRAVGFDLHPSMVAYAQASLRARGLSRRARVFVADMTRFAHLLRGARVDVAFNLINSIRHLETDAQMLAHLREVARVLRPDGLYLIGLSLTRYGHDQPEEDVWEAKRGRLHLQQWLQYLPPRRPATPDGTHADGGHRVASRASRTERVISHVIARRGTSVEHHDAHWHLRCYDAGEWRRIVARSRLQLVGVCDAHGDPIEDGDWQRPYLIFVLQRAR